MELPYVDTLTLEIAAPPDAVWDALATTVRRELSGPQADLVARAVGVRDRGFTGAFPAAGSTIPGFRVERSEPGRRLRLEGAHRFSRYALDFGLDETAAGTTRLSATTHAAFPGPAGRVYRALVIGTRGHVVVVVRMLRAVRRRAERADARPPGAAR